MIRKRKILLCICFMLFGISLLAQMTSNLSHYKLNKYLYNPACAGAEGYTSYNAIAKEQWLGFDQAPSTQAFSVETRLLKRDYKIFNPLKSISKSSGGNSSRFKMFSSQTRGKVGLGAYIYHDRIGLINNTGIQLAYSYHVFVRTTQISFGLGASMYQFNLNERNMIKPDQYQIDPLLNQIKERSFKPDANLGIFLNNRNYYGGISANRLFESAVKLEKKSDSIIYNEKRMYCLIAGSNIYLNSDFVCEPSIVYKTDSKLKGRLDLTASIKYDERIEGGIAYRISKDKSSLSRSSNEVIILIGVYYSDFYIGYAFDYSVGMYSLGSHEIALSYRIGSGERRTRYKNNF